MAQESGSNSKSSDVAETGVYTVLARRYRPQGFGEVVGQEAISQTLRNAIQSGRIAHAYLFTGARGVGKTSMARILAKALNCQAADGPTPTPCGECELCQSIATGEDMDVLEIDGASNRGIDEIRDIRANVAIRPALSRYKIYIIDEVHMLTREAFNALLKTLEEPPAHVKFIFATTEAEKIPLTILSRCQRYDFGMIGSDQIAERLRAICRQEQCAVAPEALEWIGRRAAGSMRDGQSLLDQVFAFGGDNLSLDDVQKLFGSAAVDLLADLVDCCLQQDAAGALELFDRALRQGVRAGELLVQLTDYLRDLMVLAATGGRGELLAVPESGRQRSHRQADQWGVNAISAAFDLVAEAMARARLTTQSRALIEMTLVRLCQLPQLATLEELLKRLERGDSRASGPATPASQESMKPVQASPAPATERAKTTSPAMSPPAAQAGEVVHVDFKRIEEGWSELMSRLDADGGEVAAFLRKARPQALQQNRLIVEFGATDVFPRRRCEQPDNVARVEAALTALFGQRFRVQYTTGPADSGKSDAETAAVAAPTAPPQMNYQQCHQAAVQDPLVSKAMELFGGRIVKIEQNPESPTP